MKKFKVSIVIDTKKTLNQVIEAVNGIDASTKALDDSIRANWVITSTTTTTAKE